MTAVAMSPLARVLTRLTPIEPGEVRAVVASFCLFFTMWAGYFSVRPVRETVGTVLGGDRVADLWILTAVCSVLVIPVFGLVVARFRRSAFLPATYAVVAAVLAVIGVAFRSEGITPLAGSIFYVFISVMNMFLISLFWSFLLEIFDRAQAKRLFGVIFAGGSAGALAGPLLSDLSVGYIGQSGVLFLGSALFVAAIVCQYVLLRIWSQRTAPDRVVAADDRPIGGNVFAGVTLILRSPYLIGIALFIVGLSMVSTLLYFEQLRLVALTFDDVTQRTRVFARLDWIVQGLTLFTQLFLTGRIAERFGVTTLLTLVPLALALGFLALAASNTFAVLAVIMVLRRAGEYALVRPGREMLWSPLDRETKYKAKNTVDVPVYRGADAASAQFNSAITAAGASAAAVMMVGAVIAMVWAMIGWLLGRRFEAAAASAAVPPPPWRRGAELS